MGLHFLDFHDVIQSSRLAAPRRLRAARREARPCRPCEIVHQPRYFVKKTEFFSLSCRTERAHPSHIAHELPIKVVGGWAGELPSIPRNSLPTRLQATNSERDGASTKGCRREAQYVGVSFALTVGCQCGGSEGARSHHAEEKRMRPAFESSAALANSNASKGATNLHGLMSMLRWSYKSSTCLKVTHQIPINTVMLNDAENTLVHERPSSAQHSSAS